MKIRRDVLTVSSLLFTLALLIPVPEMLSLARTFNLPLWQLADQRWITEYLAPLGFNSLANIVVGLIVVWAGYIKGAKWAWFVMLAIVWLWYFPAFILPVLPHLHPKTIAPISEWLLEAIKHGGLARNVVRDFLTFVVMVTALALPVKTFFLRRAESR